jgi:hypothetical protein
MFVFIATATNKAGEVLGVNTGSDVVVVVVLELLELDVLLELVVVVGPSGGKSPPDSPALISKAESKLTSLALFEVLVFRDLAKAVTL